MKKQCKLQRVLKFSLAQQLLHRVFPIVDIMKDGNKIIFCFNQTPEFIKVWSELREILYD